MFWSLCGATPHLPSGHRWHPTQPAARFRPRVEALEDRTVAAATTTTLTVSATSVTAGQPITLTATVTGGDLFPGFLTFYDGTTSLGGSTSIRPDGESAQRTVVLGLGTHFLKARWGGSAVDFPSESATVVVQVNPARPAPGTDLSGLAHLIPGKDRFNARRHRLRRSLTLVNAGGTSLDGPLFLVLTGLPRKVRLRGLDGVLHRPSAGRLVLDLHLGQLAAGQLFTFTLDFTKVNSARLRYTAQLVVGPA
jgi:hypothetical protein